MSIRSFRFFFAALLVSCLFLPAAPASEPGLASASAGYAPAESCLVCHAEQTKSWNGSDHDWAMREADSNSVLGNFDEARFNDAGVEFYFFQRAGRYFVRTEGEDGRVTDFHISYTFGHRPLQQYLVSFPSGRLQVLTIAWDTRPASVGGQRWFSLYPGQRFVAGDPMHWTGRYQNWNAMCADCHSTNLIKGYDDQFDMFASTWHEQNVGCQACHGPGQAHLEWAKRSTPEAHFDRTADIGLTVDFKALGGRGLIEQCAFCHSRRRVLGSGQEHGKPLLNTMLPATLRSDLYHADGQIQGEVYVYGSFTQSKMYTAGVTCTDCHDPHSTGVKVDGNGLCLQCHNLTPPARFPSLQAKNYNTPEHHHHRSNSSGANCVDCHMPETTYMIIDPRRDHSIRIPRPDLAESIGGPDACTSCHQDQSPAWATKTIEEWYDEPRRPSHYGEILNEARQGSRDSLVLLGGLIADKGKPAIVRASAAEQLAELGAPALPSLAKALQDDSALVRAYAAAGFAGLSDVSRVKHLLPLLDDPLLAVRDEAIRSLAGIPLNALPKARRLSFKLALKDYELRLRDNADLPGNRHNLAVLLERIGRNSEALDEYRQALRMDPYFTLARINFAALANNIMRQDEAEQVLRDGVALDKIAPGERGNLAFMLALLLVERGQSADALNWLDDAAETLPDNPRIRYNQGLLLLQLQQRDAAKIVLEIGLKHARGDTDLIYALIYLHVVDGDRENAVIYWHILKQVAPNDPRLESLGLQLGIL